MSRTWVLLLVAMPFVACTNYDFFKSGALLHNSAPGGPTIMGLDTPIDWTLIQTSVLNNCTNCHAGTQTPSLVTYSDICQNVTEVFSKVSAGDMPPAAEGYNPLNACQVAALQQWMKEGEPRTSATTLGTLPDCIKELPPDPTGPIQEQPLSYQVLLTRILQPKCLKCHNADDPSDASMYLFNPYSAIQSDTKLWNAPGATSVVVQFLSKTDQTRMPPPPDPALSTDEVDYISRWIDAGKPQ